MNGFSARIPSEIDLQGENCRRLTVELNLLLSQIVCLVVLYQGFSLLLALLDLSKIIYCFGPSKQGAQCESLKKKMLKFSSKPLSGLVRK